MGCHASKKNMKPTFVVLKLKGSFTADKPSDYSN